MSSVPSGSPHKQLTMWSFKISFVVCLNKLLNTQSICCWSETPWWLCDVNAMLCLPDNCSIQCFLTWNYVIRKLKCYSSVGWCTCLWHSPGRKKRYTHIIHNVYIKCYIIQCCKKWVSFIFIKGVTLHWFVSLKSDICPALVAVAESRFHH